MEFVYTIALMSTAYRTKDRGQKLMETHELQLFIHNVEDIESWIADMEGQLASEDHGKDLISVNNLLKKHTVSKPGRVWTWESVDVEGVDVGGCGAWWV